MASGSALTPAILATWPVPNYIDPVTRRAPLDAAIYATTIPMVLFVAARIYVRANQKSGIGIGIDDWIIVGATMFGIATSVTLLILTSQALGRHLYDVKLEWLVTFAKLNLATLTLYNASITLTKVSVCMTYLKLFPSRTNRLFCWTMIAYSVLWGVITSAMYILQCMTFADVVPVSPIQSLWDPTITAKMCLDSHQLLTASATLNVVSDFLIFLWPVAPLWRIQLPLPQRVHLVSVFSFGVLACVGGILKTIWAQDYFKTWDTTWVGARVSIAVVIEYNVGTMSGCLPCLRPLLAMIAPKLFAGSSAASKGSPANSGGSSWRKSPFGSKNTNSIRLGSDGPSEYADTYEFTDPKNPGAAHTSVAGGKRASQSDVDIMALPSIRVTKDISIRDGNISPGILTSDATSEEWIMKEDFHR
ncbi:integral membrane [Pyrenophora seminiperda CCB06]|uniref:Integral membrane n=1 Tax=Pyrenophora seminiperda CCB06 TaxID=1302712 RepID=A0A3M7MJB5_9PLEO|nr:integral membrane [Pyrenophora seminiperda CCB06]